MLLPCPCPCPHTNSYITTAVEVDPDKPVLVDKYLDRAIELDVDALRDQEGNIVICGIMEHIEQVGGRGVWGGEGGLSIGGCVGDGVKSVEVHAAVAKLQKNRVIVQVSGDLPVADPHTFSAASFIDCPSPGRCAQW